LSFCVDFFCLLVPLQNRTAIEFSNCSQSMSEQTDFQYLKRLFVRNKKRKREVNQESRALEQQYVVNNSRNQHSVTSSSGQCNIQSTEMEEEVGDDNNVEEEEPGGYDADDGIGEMMNDEDDDDKDNTFGDERMNNENINNNTENQEEEEEEEEEEAAVIFEYNFNIMNPIMSVLNSRTNELSKLPADS
jgi:hypothetical protein